MRVCTVCHEEKDVCEFDKNGNGGLRGECKNCRKKKRFEQSQQPKIKINNKMCTCCKKIKSIEDFNKNCYTITGYADWCKDCNNLKYKEWSKNNKDKIQLKDANYYHTHKYKKYIQHKLWILNNKARISELRSNYYRKHRTKILNKCRIYNMSHKQYVIDKWKTWHLNNELKMNLIYARRRNLGFNAINIKFNNSNAHHLHLENNHDFVIYLPVWLHKLQFHNSNNDYGMITINAIALDFWINENFYKELYEII